ncbi:MAG: hypothetical protein FJZ64_01735, partial [Chlamydiae bacterium]|nr:hypothetical protein [Chlamydiota bacterium]
LFESLLQNYKDSIIHHPEWLFEYASSLEWLGDFSGEQAHYFRAIEIFSHVLLIHPDFPEIHRHIANCYLEIGNLALEPEYYKKAIHYFRLASRQDEENDSVWLDWGICLIYLAEQTFDTNFRDQLFYDAEQKLIQAGQFGNPQTCYHLACLYSILERPSDAMTFLQKALDNKALPSLDEMAHDEWLDNLRETEAFTHFFTTLEEKLHQVREE